MRNWINILNEEWLNTVTAWEQQVDLYKNPSRSEWAKLFKKYPDGLRGHILANGDLVVWDAMYATHSDIADHLGQIQCGYRYFFPDHILFNDLNMERNEDAETPRYGWYVSRTFNTTVANASITAFYGTTPNIIGADDETTPSRFPITAEWVAQNCVADR